MGVAVGGGIVAGGDAVADGEGDRDGSSSVTLDEQAVKRRRIMETQKR
jgi:hypothetical protein